MKAGLSEVDRAHAAYTRGTLACYDWWVLGFSNRRVWGCPTEKLLDLYRANLSSNHLEVGVGTGYFLSNSLSHPGGRLALLDINRNCLDHAARRLSDFRPEVHQENVLEPLTLRSPRFDSIGLNYVLHCLPGRLEQKASLVFDHLVAHLQDDGVLFGSTLLGKDIQRPVAARMLMSFYNRRGIFSNEQDSLGGIMEALAERFRTFNVEVCGCAVLFWGKGLRDRYCHTVVPGKRAGVPVGTR